jgi:ribosome-associated translation inhibitor RaiA
MTRITVTFRGLAPSEAVQRAIVLEAKRLEQTEPDIVHCHVYVERRNKQPVERYQVDVHLTMRGGQTIASRSAQHESLRDHVEALRIAFEDVAGQLAATRLLRYQPRRSERAAASGW